MTPLAWLIGFALPACAASGAQGLPPPRLFDMGRIERPPASRLYDAVRAVAAAQPRTFLAADYSAERQTHWVVRSTVFNFPDLVTAQITGAGPDSSTLVLYSRAVYGYADLGVNRQRLNTWLAALQTKINHPGER